ncbi:Glycosyl transferase [Posidoniimonas corsicana]|uniref:Lipid-A-disaccharide synthase n=1 Tax=Posidoniimonas corsicana TaxID=1938618 RepID=A0A5C5V7X6_9BACT|nr:lipid-A-disaccharide synthase [Posidoniimonas corsicana]TWT34063.1 Glycosyl transferase [Posidoniimonas corsicana]
MNIFFSVGEPSGDLHGANLIRELKRRRPDWRMVGYGGPKMEQAGCDLHTDLTQFAVMWFLQVILNYHKFRALVQRADRYFAEHRPDAVVLIDYPGFNWHIAKKAKAHGIPVYYYGAPQLWGWAGWRVKKMRRNVDHVLVKLPFEEQWYRDRGCNATYLGHPYFDELRAQHLDEQFVASHQANGPLVTILPGSRTQEVRSNLVWQLKAAEKIRARSPGVRFAIAVFKESQRALVETELAKSGVEADVHVGRTPELIRAATCCLAVSGSVSLELLFHTKPTAIVYSVSPLAFFVQKFFRRVRYITLVNLLTAEELFPEEVGVFDPHDPRDAHVLMPEYLTCEDPSDALAGHAAGWLTDEAAREELVARMAELKERIGQGGASVRASEYLIDTLEPAAPAAVSDAA